MNDALKSIDPNTLAGSSQKVVAFHPKYMDDVTLWNSFRLGDERSMVAIFDRFAGVLYNYGYKICRDSDTTQDSIQELFIELWKNAARLGDTTSIKYYLFKSLRRKLIRTSVKEEKLMTVRLQQSHMKETSPSPEFLLIHEQASKDKTTEVFSLIDRLSKRQREAIFLRYFEELSYEEIADIMQLSSKQSVYNLISKAIDDLKNMVA